MADLPRPTGWRLTEDERDEFVEAAWKEVARWVPFGSLGVLGVKYVYARRHLLFGPDGRPLRVIDVRSNGVGLRGVGGLSTRPALSARSGRPTQTLELMPALTRSARQVGLRDGDATSLVVVAKEGSTSAGRGLIVPARFGEPVRLRVPRDRYTVATLGTTKDSLARKRDPIVGLGASVVPAGVSSIEVPTRARGTRPAAPRKLTPPSFRCPWCGGRTTDSARLLRHSRVCTKRPRSYWCFMCGESFSEELDLVVHETRCRGSASRRGKRQLCVTCGEWVRGDAGHRPWCWRMLSSRAWTWLSE